MAPSIDAKALALVAAGSAAATYLIAKRQFEAKTVAARKERYASDQKVRFAQDEARKEKNLPSGTKLE